LPAQIPKGDPKTSTSNIKIAAKKDENKEKTIQQKKKFEPKILRCQLKLVYIAAASLIYPE
jgi:hypothetical protein